MKTSSALLGTALSLCAEAATAQTASAPPAGPQPVLRQGHGVRAADDARESAILATCKNPPPAPASPPGVRPAPKPSTPNDYTVAAIPGVIAAGAQWKQLWSEGGLESNTLTFFVADGIIPADNDGILIPQSEKSQVIKLTLDGKVSVVYRDTNTGGTLSRNKKGTLFIGQRELNPAIAELAPQRRLLASRYQGDPLDCLGLGLNDLTAASNGGVYFTMGGLYYANPHGTITKYGENLRTNGLVLSINEKILYVTNGAALVAFDVQRDGSLTNQRELTTLTDGPGDGLTIDADGRIYVSGGGAGVRVVAPHGKYLGTIPTPYGAQSLTFGGPGKTTLFALMSVSWDGHTGAQIIAIPTLTRGYGGRAK